MAELVAPEELRGRKGGREGGGRVGSLRLFASPPKPLNFELHLIVTPPSPWSLWVNLIHPPPIQLFHLHMSESLQSCSAGLESQPERASQRIFFLYYKWKYTDVFVFNSRCDYK